MKTPISEVFNKKARILAAATMLTLGGYVGLESADTYNQPQESNFTLSHTPQNITEEQFIKGQIRNWSPDAAQISARADFKARIDAMADEKRTSQTDSLVRNAVSFVHDIRISDKISEQDYVLLVKDYDARVGFDVTALTGNFRAGVAFNQECQVGQSLGDLFGDDDKTPEEDSADIGACMLELQHKRDMTALGGAAGGATLSGLLALPFFVRRRDKGKDRFQVRK